MKICVLFGGHFDRYNEALRLASEAGLELAGNMTEFNHAIAHRVMKSKEHTYTPAHTKSKRGKFKRK